MKWENVPQGAMKRKTDRNREIIINRLDRLKGLAISISSDLEVLLGADSDSATIIGNIMCDCDEGYHALKREWPEKKA